VVLFEGISARRISGEAVSDWQAPAVAAIPSAFGPHTVNLVARTGSKVAGVAFSGLLVHLVPPDATTAAIND
jgi:hypothetical protein